MKYPKLRIAWSVVWSLPAVLLIALRVRSNFSKDIFRDPFFGFPVTVLLLKSALQVDWQSSTLTGATFYTLYIPYWPPTALFAVLSGASWIGWTNRFSLRALLIATTLVAVGLGLIVWLR